MKISIPEILQQIEDELVRAENKFPYWPDDIIHAAAIVNEESGELIRSAVQVTYENGNIEDARKEAIQTAATCIRFLMHINKYKF